MMIVGHSLMGGVSVYACVVPKSSNNTVYFLNNF